MAKRRRKKVSWVYPSAGGALGYGTGESLAEYLAKRFKKFKRLGRFGRIGGAAGGTLLGTLIGQQLGKFASDSKEKLLCNLLETEKDASWFTKSLKGSKSLAKAGIKSPSAMQAAKGAKKYVGWDPKAGFMSNIKKLLSAPNV
mgnify:CR=1 FL=1